MTAAKAARGRIRRLVARIGVVGLIASGAVLATAVSASADSPNPSNVQSGTAVMNPDGTITVTVTTSWVWSNKKCSQVDQGTTGGALPGYAVAWGDNTANSIGTGAFQTYVGDAQDNAVHIPGTSCTDNGGSAPSTGTFTSGVSHTYAAGTTNIAPCVVTYHVNSSTASGNHSQIAGGTNHNTDNSVEENESLASDSCAPVTIPPDVAISKTGPTSVTVGTNFDYSLTASNTGGVAADNVVISDVLPANVAFVSATDPCTFDSGTSTLTCDEGTLGVGDNVTETVTVKALGPAGTAIVNTATVTPEDGTPNDNTSTWTVAGPDVLAESVVAPPVTPAVPVAAAPAFTG